jgi:hypothetical protein
MIIYIFSKTRLFKDKKNLMCFCLFGMAKAHEIFLSIKDDQQKWYKNIDLVIFRGFKLNFLAFGKILLIYYLVNV